jgi:ligand-binding sensor domain-containing protein
MVRAVNESGTQLQTNTQSLRNWGHRLKSSPRKSPKVLLQLLALALSCFPAARAALPVRTYTTEDGLPHNRVNQVRLDSNGFLWICTDAGLSRFDGNRFVNYTIRDGLPHAHVNAVLETRRGEYWIATDAGISRFSPRPGEKRFVNYNPAGSEEASRVNVLAEDEPGSLLLGTNSGLYKFVAHGSKFSFERIDYGAPANVVGAHKVHTVAHDARGYLWLGTEHGLYVRHDAGWRHFAMPFVHCLMNEKGRLWVGFRGGFGRIAADWARFPPLFDFVRTEVAGLQGPDVRVIRFGTNGNAWLGTDGGVVEWTSNSFRAYTSQDGVAVEQARSLVEDSAGNLWIGTRRRGLWRVSRSRFETFGPAQGLQLSKEQLLIETRSGQICILDLTLRIRRVYCRDQHRFSAFVPAFPPRVLSTVPDWLQIALQDRNGAWWFSTSVGLFRFPSLSRKSDLLLLNGCPVGRFLEDAAGDLWISTSCSDQKGLARWHRDTGQLVNETWRLPSAPNLRKISAFVQDRLGQLWIGLEHPGGLLRLRDGRFEQVSASVRGHVNKLFVDSRGRLWGASTESGLFRIDMVDSPQPQIRRYSREQGLFDAEVWSIAEDRFGLIYAGTAQGVDCLDPISGRIVHYSAADGLVRGDIRSSLRDRKGDLWFVSNDGVSRFTPGDDPLKLPSPARISEIRVAGAPLPISEFGETKLGPMKFPPARNTLEIRFAAASYHLPSPLRYQFRLENSGQEGTRTKWQELGHDSTVHLASLAPGEYCFQARSLSTDGATGEPAVVAFTILQPFWQMWWFQVICGMTAAAIGYVIYTYRLRQQLAIERVRSRIATELHDDIGAGLSRICVLGEALKSDLRINDRDAARMLEDITGSSRRLVADMSDIVWSLDARRDQVSDLAARLRAFGSDMLERHGVEWSVDAPDEALQLHVSPPVRRELYLVFKEAIHNIAKHSGARKAALSFSLHNGHIRGEVMDDGSGLRLYRLDGTGLASMRARIESLGGKFEILSGDSGGTLIRASVPASRKA